MPRLQLRPDLSPFRDSRDLRLVVGANFIADMGAQATLVALPFQLYIETRSPFLVGLLGAVELGPLVALSLLGGVTADRMDRRRLLLLDQAGVFVAAGGLAAMAMAGRSGVVTLYALAALLAGFNALGNVAQSAIIPNLVDRERLPRALAVNYGLYALTMVLGPALGGLLIGGLGVQAAYAADALCCLAVVLCVLPVAPQPPEGPASGSGVLHSIAEGLRYVRGTRALLGSFAIDRG